MFDTVLLLDDSADLACPAGHRMRSVQTKDFDDPSMRTYLVHRGQLLLAASLKDDDYAEWRVDGSNAVREQRFALTDLTGPRSLRAYASCDAGEPGLVRA